MGYVLSSHSGRGYSPFSGGKGSLLQVLFGESAPLFVAGGFLSTGGAPPVPRVNCFQLVKKLSSYKKMCGPFGEGLNSYHSFDWKSDGCPAF